MPQPTSYTPLRAGAVLAKRYRIENIIGSGGYASVYRATDLTFGYERAIKEVSDPDEGVRNQFRLEGELLINTRHPNIPAGYHLIDENKQLYLVMDYVLGKDLEERLNESLTKRKQPLEELTVLEWMRDICDALEAMHSLKHPVIHRDIKPANIKITPDGRPVLIDFGLAKVQHPGPTMTAAQGVSPGFAPPEQYMARGRTDARTDTYALGATLYACLTGQDPPDAPSRLLAETGAAGGGMALVPPRRMNPRINEETNRIVLKSLELSPGKRYQTAADMRRDLTALIEKLHNENRGQALRIVCSRCGTQNASDSATCVKCGTRLRHTGDPAPKAEKPAGRANGARKQSNDGTGKQRSVGTADTPTKGRMPVAMPAKGTLLAPGGTGKHAAAAAAVVPATAVATEVSGRQKAVARVAETAAQPAVATGTMVKLPAKPAEEEKPTAARVKAITPVAETDSAPERGAWIRFGKESVRGFGKTMLVLAAVAIATRGHSFPSLQVAAAWAVVTLLFSLLGAQAISRPVYRRNRFTPVRRWLQGMGLILYTIALHGVAIWGATIFQSSQSNPTLAPVAFVLFGVNVLLVGILGIVNILG